MKSNKKSAIKPASKPKLSKTTVKDLEPKGRVTGGAGTGAAQSRRINGEYICP